MKKTRYTDRCDTSALFIFIAKILVQFQMDKLEIRPIKNKRELEQVIEIRKQVFVKGQDVPLDLEVDGLDTKADHMIVYFNDLPIGCARIRTNDDIAKLERIAILEEYRNRGFGKQLTRYLINYCKNKDYKEIYMHSQTYVSDFYKKFGFRKQGKTFFEASIKHVEMYMKI